MFPKRCGKVLSTSIGTCDFRRTSHPTKHKQQLRTPWEILNTQDYIILITLRATARPTLRPYGLTLKKTKGWEEHASWVSKNIRLCNIGSCERRYRRVSRQDIKKNTGFNVTRNMFLPMPLHCCAHVSSFKNDWQNTGINSNGSTYEQIYMRIS